MHYLDNKIDKYGFLRDVAYLKNNKASGLNGVPSNAFKCTDEKLKIVYKLICKFWEGNKDYEE